MFVLPRANLAIPAIAYTRYVGELEGEPICAFILRVRPGPFSDQGGASVSTTESGEIGTLRQQNSAGLDNVGNAGNPGNAGNAGNAGVVESTQVTSRSRSGRESHGSLPGSARSIRGGSRSIYDSLEAHMYAHTPRNHRHYPGRMSSSVNDGGGSSSRGGGGGGNGNDDDDGQENNGGESGMEGDASRMLWISSISHEFRTPLNAIFGMIQILSESTSLTEEEHEYFAVIEHASRTLLTLVNDLLDFSKLQSGKLEIESIEFSLRTLCEECLQYIFGTALAKEIELHIKIPNKIPNVLVGDPNRIRQVILNFLSNAIKFTSQGQIMIQAYILETHIDSLHLEIAVKDSGIGIAKSKMANLFQDFSQLDSTVARKFGGSGLGLSISRKLIDAMGGEVGVDSELGKGSTFWFSLHLGLPPSFEPPLHDTFLIPTPPGTTPPHLVLAHQNDAVARALSETLRTWGLAVSVMSSVREAIHLIRMEPARYSLFILDGAIANIEQLVSTYGRPYGEFPPILVLANPGQFEPNDVAMITSVPVVVKPVRDRILFSTIRTTLSLPSAGIYTSISLTALPKPVSHAIVRIANESTTDAWLASVLDVESDGRDSGYTTSVDDSRSGTLGATTGTAVNFNASASASLPPHPSQSNSGAALAGDDSFSDSITLPPTVVIRQATMTAPPESPLKPLQLALIDDNKVNNLVLSKFLRSLGVPPDCITKFNTGTSFLEEAATRLDAGDPFRIVFCDMNMPQDLSGQETMAGLRELEASLATNQAYSPAALVPVTGMIRTDAEAVLGSIDVAGFLIKPIELPIVKSVYEQARDAVVGSLSPFGKGKGKGKSKPRKSRSGRTTKGGGGDGKGKGKGRREEVEMQIHQSEESAVSFSLYSSSPSLGTLGTSLGSVPVSSQASSRAPPQLVEDNGQPPILVVDDNSLNRLVLAKNIRRLGFNVMVANNGEEAVDKWKREGPILAILMDCVMPGMDGLEAAQCIRNLEATGSASHRNRVPIIAVTAKALPEDRGACLAAGMDEYISKPVEHLELLHKLEMFGIRPIPQAPFFPSQKHFDL